MKGNYHKEAKRAKDGDLKQQQPDHGFQFTSWIMFDF